MAFLFSTQKVINRNLLPSTTTHAAALSLLQDISAFTFLQPLVTSSEPIPTPNPTSWAGQRIAATLATLPPDSTFSHRAVTIAVPMVAGMTSSMTTHSSYVNTSEGIIVHFEAPMWLHGTNVWTIQGEEPKLELVEEAELTGLRPLMGFVIGSKKTSHAELGKRFATKLEGGD